VLEIHSEQQAEVLASGQAVLDALGLTEADRLKPAIASLQFITNVHPYQAQLLNKWRKGSMLLPGQSLLVLEVAPAAYISIAANEAEKAASVTVIELRAVGRPEPRRPAAILKTAPGGAAAAPSPQPDPPSQAISGALYRRGAPARHDQAAAAGPAAGGRVMVVGAGHVGMIAAARLAEAAGRGQVLPAAVLADGSYGIEGVYVGLPARLGRGGVLEIVELPLTPAELRQAADRISERLAALAAPVPVAAA